MNTNNNLVRQNPDQNSQIIKEELKVRVDIHDNSTNQNFQCDNCFQIYSKQEFIDHLSICPKRNEQNIIFNKKNISQEKNEERENLSINCSLKPVLDFSNVLPTLEILTKTKKMQITHLESVSIRDTQKNDINLRGLIKKMIKKSLKINLKHKHNLI